jgi:hypothetical protein
VSQSFTLTDCNFPDDGLLVTRNMAGASAFVTLVARAEGESIMVDIAFSDILRLHRVLGEMIASGRAI